MQKKPAQIPFTFGRERNTATSPHHVLRPYGTDTWILEYTFEGRGFICVNGRRQPICPGELLLFRAGVRQDYGMDRAVGLWDHIWTCFHPRPNIMPLLDWPEMAPGVFRLVPEHDEMRQRIAELFVKALHAAHGPLVRGMEFAYVALEELFLWCDTINPRSESPCFDARIQDALEYICNHFMRVISIGELARRCNLSESRFSHLFCEQVGTPPIQYLEKYRMRRAREMLLMTRKPVNVIAREIGYDNALYFSRIFRRHVGESPRTLRKRLVPSSVSVNTSS